jgi:hypothetical protein
MNKREQAIDPKTPPKVLEQLATDDDYSIRYWVACNPNTPPKALEQLATNKNSDVRWRVARNPNTPHYIKKYIKIKDHLSSMVLMS